MRNLKVLLLFGIIFIFSECSKDESPAVCTTTPTYTGQVKAIIDSNCAISGCHTGPFPADGRDYSNYTLLKGQATDSKFLKSIKHLSGAKAMPENASKLPDSAINAIECWIVGGTPE